MHGVPSQDMMISIIDYTVFIYFVTTLTMTCISHIPFQILLSEIPVSSCHYGCRSVFLNSSRGAVSVSLFPKVDASH